MFVPLAFFILDKTTQSCNVSWTNQLHTRIPAAKLHKTFSRQLFIVSTAAEEAHVNFEYIFSYSVGKSIILSYF